MHPVTLKRRDRKKQLLELLGGKCINCGATEGLEFDHLDPKEKEFRISEMLDWGEEKLKGEALKCQLLCKPCHHQKTLDKWEYGAEAPHGGTWRWRKYKCRCPKCVAARDRYNEFRRQVYHMKIKVAEFNFNISILKAG